MRRLDIRALLALFGTKQRPRTNRRDLSPRVAAVIETPQFGLAILAGVRRPRRGRKPASWTAIDRHYEAIPHRHAKPSTTSPSPPRRHRQRFVDPERQAP